MNKQTIGFEPEEFDPNVSTREARLKWVIVVDEALPAGRAVNAAVCVAAATTRQVHGLLGPDVADADRAIHPGLPWLGCSVLAVGSEKLLAIRSSAAARDDVFVADMPEAAQATKVYAEYIEQVTTAGSAALVPLAVSIVGPRNRVDRIVGGLPLLR